MNSAKQQFTSWQQPKEIPILFLNAFLNVKNHSFTDVDKQTTYII